MQDCADGVVSGIGCGAILSDLINTFTRPHKTPHDALTQLIGIHCVITVLAGPEAEVDAEVDLLYPALHEAGPCCVLVLCGSTLGVQ